MLFNLLLIGASIASVIAAVSKVPFQGNRVVETMVPMRDGVKLHTVIVFPPGSELTNSKYTVIMDRSPYGYRAMEWLTDIFVPLGFVGVGQDMRGTQKSEGNFSIWTSDGNDSRDLGDWIIKQDWSNGQIMTFGASADGIGSLQTPRTNPDWLKAQYVVWATARMYDMFMPNGAYKQKTFEDWITSLTMPNPDVVNDNLRVIHENEAHTDFWSQIEINETVYRNVRAPNGFWGGWYDLCLYGTIQAFEGYNTQSDPSIRHKSVITIDPLGHCLEGADYFTENAVKGRTALVLGQIFEVFGIHQVIRPNIKNVTFYVMSSNDQAGHAAGQYWTTLETWPAAKMVNYYFHADKTASTTLPSNHDDQSSSSYKYDPADPVPTIGGDNLPDSLGGTIPCGPLDQTEADKRSDVLTFQTEVAKEELAITGGILATLYVSSDAIDTDFTVKISDVYPTGEARILQDNAFRMRWREGTTPVYMEKGNVYKIEMKLSNTSYIIAPGHAIRFSVSSSNFPRFNVNPNNGLLLADPNYPGQSVVATNTLYHSARYPSHVTLPIVRKIQMPECHILKEMQAAYPMLDEIFLQKATEGLHRMITSNSRINKI